MNHTFIIRYRDDVRGYALLCDTLADMRSRGLLVRGQAFDIFQSEAQRAKWDHSGRVITTCWIQDQYQVTSSSAQ